MKKLSSVMMLALLGWLGTSNQAQAQYNNWAGGFRIGEPAGVNIRKYFGENHAFDLNVGTYGGLYGNVRSYRRGRFKNVGLVIQGHYLWHGEVGKSQTLHYYYGFGGQLTSRRYYPDNQRGQPVDYNKNIGIGGSAVAGLEYFLPNKPTSIFIETGLYAEVVPAIFFVNVQSGIGLRFNL